MKDYKIGDQEALIHIDKGIEKLREARDLFKAAECPKTTERIRKALASAGGARRSAEHRHYRRER